MKLLKPGLLLSILMSTLFSCQTPKYDFAYQDTRKSFEERVNLLLTEMTLEEKLSQLTHNNKAIPRLGIPEYGWWNEALHGVAFSGRATVFPQPIGLASSWNNDLLNQIGDAISTEARAKHHDFARKDKRNNFQGLTFWTPNINIFRDPRWGRGIETYGEDPFLTGRLAVNYIKGLQGDDEKYFKIIATPKHYAVHSGPEPDRHHFNATTNDKDLYETYLPHFKEAIQEGGAYSIMSAYNRYNGESCSGHPRLLTEILRDDWGFEGVVVSDCGAIRDIYEFHKVAESEAEAAAIGIKSGCDLNCGEYYKFIKDALDQGLVSEADIDIAVGRILLARFRLGMFDPPEEVPYASIPIEAVNSQKNQDLALQAARESIVLLKNENQTLPLKDDIKKIAVIGPNANDVEVLLGNYNGLPFEIETPLEGIRKRAPESCEVLYALGTDWVEGSYVVDDFPEGKLFTRTADSLEEGLKAELFNNSSFEGEPLITQIDKKLKFDWKDNSPHDSIPNDHFSIRWSGILKVDKTGEYIIGGEGHHGYHMYIEDSLFLRHNEFYHENAKRFKSIALEADKEYPIRIEYYHYSGDANFRMLWVPSDRNLEKEAIQVAEQADVVVMCMGLSPRLEGEEQGIKYEGFYGGDRTSIDLPKNQQALIKTIAKTGKPIVLVLLNGSALAINWEDENIPAILDAWYPGQAAGVAIADVLFGEYNPSGKLPVTFYKSVDDLPDFKEYDMKNRTYRYFKGTPLYSFGYGLSYTQFVIDELVLPETASKDEKINLRVNITNQGDLEGSEVVQVYIKCKTEELKANYPNIALKGFKKVNLNPGETKTVELELNPEHFAYVNDKGESVLTAGKFEISVGGIQPDFESPTTNATQGIIELK